MTASRFIDSDDPIVADHLASTIELVAEAGGWIAPITTIVSRSGQLHVESTEPVGAPLLHVPQHAFIRVDDVTWSDSSERLEMLDVPDHFGDIETELLYVQVALHNQCNKLSWMSKTHPWLAPNLPDEVIEAVRTLLPTFRIPEMSAADTLWANRCFRIAFGDEGSPQRVLIPLVDLLNHHNDGATGTLTDGAFEVDTVRPFESGECALNYGMNRDPLEMAAVYGFVDLSHATINRAIVDDHLNASLIGIINACDKYPKFDSCGILRDGAQQVLMNYA